MNVVMNILITHTASVNWIKIRTNDDSIRKVLVYAHSITRSLAHCVYPRGIIIVIKCVLEFFFQQIFEMFMFILKYLYTLRTFPPWTRLSIQPLQFARIRMISVCAARIRNIQFGHNSKAQ